VVRAAAGASYAGGEDGVAEEVEVAHTATPGGYRPGMTTTPAPDGRDHDDDHDQDSDPPTPDGQEPGGPNLDPDSDEPGANPDPEVDEGD
jgi:hypothetical protein